MDLEATEKAINEHYKFFAVRAPGVRVQEIGRLEELWALADFFYAQEDNELD